MATSGQAPAGWYRMHGGQVEYWTGQAWLVWHKGAPGDADTWEDVAEGFYGYWDGQTWLQSASVVAQDPHHQRRVRRLWILVGTAVGIAALGGVIRAGIWWSSTTLPHPDTTVMNMEFEDEPDLPLTTEPGYTWEQRGGKLLLTPTEPGWHVMSWDVGSYEALGAQSNRWPPEPTAADSLAGVAVTNAEGEGVALVCNGEGLPTLFDITSGDTLAEGVKGECFDWPNSTLEVTNDRSGGFLADGCPFECGSSYALSAWPGNGSYGSLSRVGIIFRADAGDTTFEVDFVAAAAPGEEVSR